MGKQNQMVVTPGNDLVRQSMILADDQHDMNVSDVEEELGYPPIHHSPWVQRATEQGSSMLSWVRKLTRGRYEDWLYLTLLGCLMGLYSFSIDVAVQAVQKFRMTTFLSTSDMASRVTIWFTMTSGLAVVAALFIARFIPSATGSGFPEIKAYLQGVKMENTFSPLTCIGKLVFLPITLCTLLPLGKEGPVTHVAAIFALFITKVFKDISVEEMERHSGNELVAAACTMGAAVCYGAPVGGVLFSIEATRSYFAVRNYWRGFFAAVCGTLFYKALSQVYHGIDILPMFPVIYNISLPCDGEFILISVSVGLVCGLLGPLFVWTHSKLLWMFSTLNSLSPLCSPDSGSKSDSSDLKKPSLGSCFSGMFSGRGGCTTSSGGLTVFRVVHTIVVCVLISALMLPWFDGFSPVMSHVPTRTQLTDLLANISWSSASPVTSTTDCIDGGASGVNQTNCSLPSVAADDRSSQIMSNWTNGFRLDFRAVLAMYILYFFFGTMLCTTLTLPSGTLVPLLRVGFALGRLVGETYCGLLPDKCIVNPIIPGCLASMFGAALCASVTHALSISVIVFEMTGQITHIMAVLIAVMVANALSRHLQPSFYDSLIRAKKITVLPKMSLSNIFGGYSNVTAQDIMATQFTYLSNNVPLSHVRQLVSKISLSKVIPLVNDNMEPLGLVHVRRLRRLLREEIGHLAWQRDKAKYYVTVNAFRALDLQQLLDAKAVDRLDLEISSAAFAEQPPSSDASEDSDTSSARSTDSPPSSDRTSPATVSRNRATTVSAAAGGGDASVNTSKMKSKNSASALAPPSVRVDAYCTVHQNDSQQLQTRLKAVRRKSIISRGGVLPLRSALDRQQLKRLDTVREQQSPSREPDELPSTAASNSPNVAGFTTSTPHNRRQGGVRPRFTIRRVKEDGLSAPESGLSHRSSSQSSLPSQGLTSDGGAESRDDRSSNQQSASPLNSASSVDSSQGRSTRDRTAITSAGHDSVDVLWPLGSSRAIDIRNDQSRQKDSRQNVETSGVRDHVEPPSNRAPSEVYDSLVSQSSHTNRMREGLSLILPSRRKTMDLAERASNRQLRSQFSFSDMHDKSKFGSSTNLNSIIQKTLDKTSGLFTAIRSPPKENLTEEWRLRRAWRRDRLRRVLDIREVIDVDPFPLAVNVDTPLVQLHKLFAMLAANKLYVLDRRKLVGCLPLLRFSDFITRGRVEDDTTSVSAGETTVSVGRTLVRSEEEFGSQDTLDDVDDGVYDTITERPSTLQPDMIV